MAGIDDLPRVLLEGFVTAVEISLFVLLMMVIVDYVNVWTQGRLTVALKGGRGRQYLLSSVLGGIPGCLGVFMVVTLYIRGMLSFGGLTAGFLATTGDVAFVMLAEIPRIALILFGILFLSGVLFGVLADWLLARLQILPGAECKTEAHHLAEQECRCWPEQGVLSHLRSPHPLRLIYLATTVAATAALLLGWLGPAEWNWERIGLLVLLAAGAFVVVTVPDHYLAEHIGHHITRHHLPRVFAWTLGTLLILGVAEQFVDIKAVASEHVLWMILFATLAGLVPDSGPQLAFVFLFAEGAVPFSVLLANSVAQSGHGLLPLLSASRRDSVLVKAINLACGLLFGTVANALGY